MKKIIIDTNALMAISEFKLDLFSVLENLNFKFKLFVLSGTIDELHKIQKQQRGKFKQAASLALSLLKAKKISAISSNEDVDDVLVNYSKTHLVLTQDIALKKRLHRPYLTIRQKKKINLIE